MAAPPGPDVRTVQVRRNTALLVVAQIALWAALASFAAFGPLTVDELTGSDTAVGGVLAAYYAALAPGAILAGRMMDRRGRRPGLMSGYAAITLSGVISIVAAATGSVVGVFIAAIVLGAGAGAALLGRAAVADMYEPERRGRAIGVVVMAGTVGAVAGAPLAGGAAVAARSLGTTPSWALAAPWLLVPLFGVAALVAVRGLHPDPRRLAVGGAQTGGRSPREVLRGPEGRRALIAIAVIQAVMVAFMGVFPVALRRAGTGDLAISVVVGAHLAGMFALSQPIGAALDRVGRRPVLAASAVVTMAGVILEMASRTPLVGGIGLVLIGIGWSGAYLGSTAIVSDLATPAERGRALGLTDLVAAASGTIGVVIAAFLYGELGIGTLGAAALVLLVLPLAFGVIGVRRAPARG